MKKILVYLITVLSLHTNAQTTQDTINNPYWRTMMGNRSLKFRDIQRAYDLYFSNKPKTKASGFKFYERWASRARYQQDANGNFLPSDHVIKEFKKFKANNLTPRSSTGSWTNLGPFNNPSPASMLRGVGRINAIGFHPTNSNTIYCGAPQGGFWRSTNNGNSWSSTTDNLPTLGVSDIVTFDDGSGNVTILIGTGDRDATDDWGGNGVMVSTDGGSTFTNSSTGMTAGLRVNKFAVNPQNNQTIYAATSGGIYSSYDQGTTWVKRTTNSFNYTDIKYSPDDSSFLYATNKFDGTNACNLYKSTNSGVSWNVVSTGFSASARYRMVIGVTEANPEIVYVLAARLSDRGFDGFYKSSNRATTFSPKLSNTYNILGWTTNGSDPTQGGQGEYDLAIETSHIDSNIVYTGGVNLYKTVNGGTSFTGISSWNGTGGKPWVHADIHFIGKNPINKAVIYIGSDGGVDWTADGGSTFFNKNNQLAISQFYNMGISQKSKTKFITGAQDNGTSMGSSTTTWTAEIGGDGMHCEVSNFDTTKMLGSVYDTDLRRSTDNGANWFQLNTIAITDNKQWVSPFHLHPRVNDVFALAQNSMWISKNILTAGTPTYVKAPSGLAANVKGTALRFSNKNDSICFIGFDNGDIKYCPDIFSATPTLTACASPSAGAGSYPFGIDVTDIETSYHNENIVYCTKAHKVFKSTNKGASWTDITGNLPNIQMFSIVLDKNAAEGLYVGTDAGVYFKDSTMGSNWMLFNTGLPAQSAIRDLDIVYDTLCSSNGVIFAATFGRGLWRGDLRISETQPIPNFTIPSTACSGIPVTVTNTTTTINPGGILTYQWTVTPSAGVFFTSGTSDTSKNPIISFNNTGNYTISLKAYNTYGGFCRITKTNIVNVGNGGVMTMDKTSDTVCPGDTVYVKLLGFSNYTFSPITGTFKLNDSIYGMHPTNAEYFEIVGGSAACSDTDYFSYFVFNAPNISETVNLKFCKGDSTNLITTGADSLYISPMTNVTMLTAKTAKLKPDTTTLYNLRYVTAGLCDVKTSKMITVQKIPDFRLSINTVQSICVGDSVMVFDSSATPGKVWTPNINVSSPSPDNYTFKPTTPTVYYVNSIDNDYCPSIKDSIEITSKPIPLFTIGGSNELCIGQNLPYTASDTNLTYTWSPSAVISSATVGYLVYCNPSSDVILTVTGSNGICTHVENKSIIVGTSPAVLTYSGNTTICGDKRTELIVSGADNYQWKPTEYFNNEFNDSVRVNVPMDTTVTVIGYKIGCVDSLKIPLSVHANPIISYQLDNPNSICQGDTVNLTGFGAITYSLYPNYNQSKLSVNSYKLYPLIATDYYLQGTDQYGCSALDTVSIGINPNPTVTVSPNNVTIDRGKTLVLTANGGNFYEWTPDQYITSANNQLKQITIQPDSDIVYTVKVTSSQGCVSEGIAIIYVLQNSSKVSNSIIQNVLIFPNPVANELNIEATEEIRYSLYNINGTRILYNTGYTTRHIADVSNLADGVYSIMIENKSGKRAISKIQVKH